MSSTPLVQSHDGDPLVGYTLDADFLWRTICLGLSALILMSVIWVSWEQARDLNPLFSPLSFMPDTLKLASDILSAIALIALLMERAIDVFVINQRGYKRSVAKNNITRLKDQIKASESESASEEIEAKLAQAEANLIVYRTGTKLRASSFAILFGMLIAVSGVRAVTPLLDVSFEALNNFQWAALQAVDIAFTAGLIAGGSTGLHAIISAIGKRTDPNADTSVDWQTRPA